MRKFAVLLFITTACATGCRSLVQCRESESPIAPANLKEQTTVDLKPELDPSKTGCPIPNERENERLAFYPLVSESAARHVPGKPSGENGHAPDVDPWLICPDLRNELADTRQQPLAGDLWNIGCASTHGPLCDNGWLGVGIRQTPYNCLSEELKAVNAFVKVSQGEARAWFVGWSYSGTGTQPYPVPRMQHVWHLSDRVRVNAGVMFPNMVDPTFDISVSIRR